MSKQNSTISYVIKKNVDIKCNNHKVNFKRSNYYLIFLQLINVSFISKYFDTINYKESV